MDTNIIEVADGSTVLKPVNAIRVGWEEDAMQAAQEEDDLADFDALEEEDLSWWTWE
ncbi:hypothetical protein EZS27_025251 [termite gut metagenome]|uniref:Uncharacterized protein n=1 Tax=termite gut metagenome TaxID=433724 RepID=A0A5J4QXD6_9ZZZZ